MRRRRKPVLEVGSGHAPDVRADILVDRYFTDVEREGPLARTKPLTLADGHQLPFKDNAFGLVVAHQVLEHVEDPCRFLHELARVAEEVEIETPSPLTEVMFEVRDFHRWAIWRSDGELVALPIADVPKARVQGAIFEALYRSNLFVYLLIRGRPDVFLTRWRGCAPAFRWGTEEELNEAIASGLSYLVNGRRATHTLWAIRAVLAALRDRRLLVIANLRHWSKGHL